jgi:hypothetical protein
MRIPTSRAATPSKIPRASPAFAPPDIPSLSVGADEADGVAEIVEEAVAEMTPTTPTTDESGEDGVGDLVATTRVDCTLRDGVVVSRADGTWVSFSDDSVVVGAGLLVAGARVVVCSGSSSSSVELGWGRTAGGTSVLRGGSSCSVFCCTLPPPLLGTVTISTATTVSTTLRCRRTRRCACACSYAIVCLGSDSTGRVVSPN